MDEDNYFKLFDQYIGTPKLVSKLYQQVKNDFLNLNDAAKFCYSNSFSDDFYDNYDYDDYDDDYYDNYDYDYDNYDYDYDDDYYDYKAY